MTTPDVPANDGLPPGQPFVSPDDLASVAPLWDAQVAKLLPLVAQIYQESSGRIHAKLIDEADLPDLPGVSSLAAETYLSGVANVYDGVGDQLWANAQSQLVEGFQNGESIPQLAARLRGAAELTASKAVLVARSTVIEASNAGSIATARASGLDMLKEWIETSDGRTRETHRQKPVGVGGTRVDLNDTFTVGGFPADAPGDPSLPGEEKYNCRCTLGYVMGRNDVHQAQLEAHQQAQQDALPNTTAPAIPSSVSEDEAPALLSELSPTELARQGVPPLASESEAVPVIRPAGRPGGYALPPRPIVVTESPALAEQSTRSASRAAARERNRAIAKIEPVAKLSADIDQILGAAGRPHRLDDATVKLLDQALTDARQAGLSADDLARIESAVARYNGAAIEDTTARLVNERGLTAQGARGDVVKYDPATMDPISEDVTIRKGQRVTVWRQGHSFAIDGDTVQLDRTVVKTIPKVEPPKAGIKVARRGAPNEAQPRLDELFKGLRSRKAIDRHAAEQAIKDGIDGAYADLKVETDSVTYVNGEAFIRGRVVNDAGDDVGEFARQLHRDADGKLVASHESLELDPNVQGSGFANEFNQNLYDWYRRSGFDRVELYASNDVGGYAWATQGFDFADTDVARAYAVGLRSRLDGAAGVFTRREAPLPYHFPDLSREQYDAQIAEFRAALDRMEAGEHVSAYDLSQIGRQPGQGGREDTWMGKFMMLHTNWNGVKPL